MVGDPVTAMLVPDAFSHSISLRLPPQTYAVGFEYGGFFPLADHSRVSVGGAALCGPFAGEPPTQSSVVGVGRTQFFGVISTAPITIANVRAGDFTNTVLVTVLTRSLLPNLTIDAHSVTTSTDTASPLGTITVSDVVRNNSNALGAAPGSPNRYYLDTTPARTPFSIQLTGARA